MTQNLQNLSCNKVCDIGLLTQSVQERLDAKARIMKTDCTRLVTRSNPTLTGV